MGHLGEYDGGPIWLYFVDFLRYLGSDWQVQIIEFEVQMVALN